MVERLHKNHNCMRLVCTSIQKCQLLSVDWPLEILFPPRRTLLRTGGKLLQITGLIILNGKRFVPFRVYTLPKCSTV